MPTHIDYATEQLVQPLNRKYVSQRSQSGRSLSYIEGWHAIAEANRIFGFDGWTRETVDMRCVSEKARKIGRDGRDGWGVSYVAKVRVVALGVAREGTGTGHGIDADLGLAHESALKEAETDAMKRALMTFGNPFGLALYDKTQANVADGVDDHDAPGQPEIEHAPAIPRVSSNKLKTDQPDLWGKFEKEMRACQTTEELKAVWDRYSSYMPVWPDKWQNAADDEYINCKDSIKAKAA